MSKHIAIVGGGQAAASFAAKLRSLDSECNITLYSDESVFPYQRPPLSKKYATGEMSADQLLLRPADWYEANAIKCRLGHRVASIDTDAHALVLTNGEKVSWDKLMFATGSRARELPEAIGGKLPGVHLLRNVKDADDLSSMLVEGKKVTIVGGGYIGLEAAAVCASLGLDVTLVEAADRILQRVACKETSDWFRAFHQSRGVKIIEHVGLARLEETSGRVSAAVLSDGSTIACDFVLVGIGIVPNDDLAKDSGLETDNGIVVNHNCQTSHEDIYAAGDCTVFDYRGERIRLESVQNAIDQAECAALNIAYEATSYHPYPWFWSDQYDVKLQIAGLNRGYDTVVVREGQREGSVSHFYFAGESFLAVDSMNDPRTYMVCKKVLESGKNILPNQASDMSLELKSLM